MCTGWHICGPEPRGCLEIRCLRTWGPISFSKQNEQPSRCNAQSSAHWEDFPSLLSFGDVPERRCNASPAVNQTRVFLFLIQLDVREFLMRLNVCGLRDSKPCSKRVGGLGIWATSSWNWLALSEPALSQSHMYHLHLTMTWWVRQRGKDCFYWQCRDSVPPSFLGIFPCVPIPIFRIPFLPSQCPHFNRHPARLWIWFAL